MFYEQNLSCPTDEDFSPDPIEIAVLESDHDTSLGRYEFTVNIAINNDGIQEPEEYFLVVLDVQNSDPEKLQVDPNKRCSKIRIREDKSGKEHILCTHTSYNTVLRAS